MCKLIVIKIQKFKCGDQSLWSNVFKTFSKAWRNWNCSVLVAFVMIIFANLWYYNSIFLLPFCNEVSSRPCIIPQHFRDMYIEIWSASSKGVHRFLVRGSMPTAAWGEENCENLTTNWCIRKYIWINMWQHSAILYTCLPWLLSKFNVNIENCSFCMFSLFNFSSVFPGEVQLTPFAPMCGRPWLHPQVSVKFHQVLQSVGAFAKSALYFMIWYACIHQPASTSDFAHVTISFIDSCSFVTSSSIWTAESTPVRSSICGNFLV